MFPTLPTLRAQLRQVIVDKATQGHVTDGLEAELDGLCDSYDALFAFADRLRALPLHVDWPYVEPNDLEGIWAACAHDRPLGVVGDVDLDDSARRVEAAFLGSVCGCILGKPLEISPTLAMLRTALEAIGEWPLSDYVSEHLREHLPHFHGSWTETVREHITYVAPDDDINYTVMGMLLLEQHGVDFTQEDVRRAWLLNLPLRYAFGPERTMLIRAGQDSLTVGESPDIVTWAQWCNPGDEKCGALIRADAFGYACPGRPALAAELAWRDASWTHRRTGIYGEMFVAAVIALAQVAPFSTDGLDRLDIFETALKFVPQRSRFYEIVADSLNEVRQATDWLDGYDRIHGKYAQYGHCLVYQEVGTLINTLRFAESVGDGICKQVSQGNDTDSFGATAGSILGAYFGPGYLEDRWLAPFNDDFRCALARFDEQSLSRLAKRMGELPRRIAGGDECRGNG